MAHPSNPCYKDGDYSTPVLISRRPREYPFAQNGDITTAVYDATYLVDQAAFAPTARGTVDPDNAGFYLIAESRPEIFQGSVATFRRTYSRIPLDQTVVSSVMVSKPQPTGTMPKAVGDYRVFQPDTSLLLYDAYEAQTVTSGTAVPGFYPTGGTYTIVFAGSATSNIAYNADAATVQTALNALAGITARGGVTVTGSYNSAGGFTITFNDYATASVSTGSLDPSGLDISSSITPTNGGYTQNVTISAASGVLTDVVSMSTGSLTGYSGSTTSTPTITTESSNYVQEITVSRSNGTHATGSADITGLTAGGASPTATVNPFSSGYSQQFAIAPSTLDDGSISADGSALTTGGGGVTTSAVAVVTASKARTYLVKFDGVIIGGTFTITIHGQTTSALAYNASAATVSAAINALSNITDRGEAKVQQDTTGTNSIRYHICVISKFTGGTYTLTLLGQTTSAIAYNANGPTTIASALNALSNVTAAGGISIAGGGWAANTTNIGSGFGLFSYEQTTITFTLTFPAAVFTGGTYALTFAGDTTSSLAYNASYADIEAALNALSSIGTVTVSAHSDESSQVAPWNGTNNIRFRLTFTPTNTFTGGTYTVTIFSQTTAALAYNAGAGTIQSALNALSNVTARGGCSVSGSGLSGSGNTISFGISFSVAAVIGNPASLTPAGSTMEQATTDGGVGRVQTLKFAASSSTRDLYVGNHGITTSDTLFIKADSTYHASVPFSIPDGNTIRITVLASAAYASATAITEAGKRTRINYAPGAAAWPCKRITSFYLPGVTPGITTVDDIPIPEYEGDADTLLLALFSGDTVVNYQVGDLTQWRDSPIISLTKITINVANF